ncbi:hypothetical protein Tco_1373545, partial [Tanacetum coccineum]
TFNELRVGDSVHISGDSHALWSFFKMHAFSFKQLHEIFRRFSFFLLDVVDFYRILDSLLLLKRMNGSVSSHTHGCDKSSSSTLDLCFFNLDFQCPPALSSLS